MKRLPYCTVASHGEALQAVMTDSGSGSFDSRAGSWMALVVVDMSGVGSWHEGTGDGNRGGKR